MAKENEELEELDNELEENEQPEPELPEVDEASEEAIKNALSEDDEEENAEEGEDQLGADSVGRVSEAMELFRVAEDARRKYDREWLSRDLFRRGYHFVRQDASSGAVTLTSTTRARIPINYLWAYMRSIRNQVTGYDPKWEVLPDHKGERSKSDASLSGKLLDNLYHKMQLKKKIREIVVQGLTFSIGGPFEIIWNPHYDNGPKEPCGEVEIFLHDPFDVYYDPTNPTDPQFWFKAVYTPIQDVKNDQRYDERARDMIKGGSSKQAQSEYKQFLLQIVRSNTTPAGEEDGIIVYEMQRKETQEDGSTKIRYLTYCDASPYPLRDELVDQEEFDFVPFEADVNPLELYGDSWSKQVIPMNRALDALESSIFEYNYRFAKGRLVIDKNSGIKAVTNEHGSIIEKNRGAEVRDLPLAPLPSTTENQVSRMRQYMADVSGVQDPMLGRVPAGVKSGIGIAELKQSSATNQDDLVQALEECLMRVGQKVLTKVSKHYTVPRIRRVVGVGNAIEHFAVVGEGQLEDNNKSEWKVGSEKYPLAHISGNSELRVTIGSWLNYSKEAQQRTIMELATAGIISSEDVLRHFEFPNVEDVVDRARAEKIIEMKRKEVKEMPLGISQEELAYEENEMLLEGNPMPVDPVEDDHELHIAIHQSALSEGSQNQIVLDHIAEHRRAQKGGGQTIQPQSMNQVPPSQPPAQPVPMPQGQMEPVAMPPAQMEPPQGQLVEQTQVPMPV